MVCYWLVLWGPCFFFFFNHVTYLMVSLVCCCCVWEYTYLRTKYIKSRGKCFPSSRGRGENCSLCALLLLLILLSTLFSFPVTYKDGQSLLWKWSLFQWSACCQLLSVQFGSLIKSFFSHSNCCRICAKAIRKKSTAVKKGKPQRHAAEMQRGWQGRFFTLFLYWINGFADVYLFSPLAFSFLWTFTLLSCTHTDYVTLLTSYYCQCWGSNTTHRVDSAFLVHIRMALLITAFRLREVHSCVFCCCLAHRRRAAKEMRGISLGAWIKFAMGDRCHVRTGAMCQ